MEARLLFKRTHLLDGYRRNRGRAGLCNLALANAIDRQAADVTPPNDRTCDCLRPRWVVGFPERLSPCSSHVSLRPCVQYLRGQPRTADRCTYALRPRPIRWLAQRFDIALFVSRSGIC